jgi:hypothetical protein
MFGVVILFSVILATIPANGQSPIVPTFKDPEVFPIGLNTHPYGIAAGDINNDGYPDIVVAHSGQELSEISGWSGAEGRVEVFHNTKDWDQTGNGLTFVQSILVNDVCATAEVALAYINDDIWLDLIVSASEGDPDNPDTFWGVKVYYNQGGTFNSFASFELATDQPVRGLVVTNIDDENKLDIVATPDFFGTGKLDIVYVWRSDPNDLYGEDDDYTHVVDLDLGDPEYYPMDIVADDFYMQPGTHRHELVVANYEDDSYSTARYVSTEDPPFEVLRYTRDPVCNDCETWSALSLASGRFGPGPTIDFAALQPPYDVCDDLYVNVFDGNVNATFSHDCMMGTDHYKIHYPGGGGSPIHWTPPMFSMTSGNLDAGTWPELVATVNTTNELAILMGNGDGTFSFDPDNSMYYVNVNPGGGVSPDLYPIQIVIADMDQDGFGDIITANHNLDTNIGSISVLINRFLVNLD